MKKWRRTGRRLLAAAGSLSLGMGLITPMLSTPVLAAESVSEATADLYPQPQSLEYDADGKEGMLLPDSLEIVCKTELEDILKTRLETILESAGITFEYSQSTHADKASLILSKDAADLPNTGEKEESALREEQGYVLVTDNDRKEAGEILLVGADDDGLYNGVLSLKQILKQKNTDGRIAEVAVADYPDVKMRGHVEGFYGLPWSADNRVSVIEQASDYKINTYIYAPKDDPYHKDSWRTLYPEAEAAQLKRLVDVCNANNVEFIWCAHPGDGYNYSTDTDYDYLIAKIDQLYDLGVRRFGLSYDDLSGSANGANQAALINRVGAYLKAKDPSCGSMITVGQRYTDGWGADWNTYLKPYLSGLDDDVVVMWTGKNTGGNCDADSFNGPKNRVGYEQDLGFWFNYPVNDMAFGRILMGEIKMSPDVESLRGFFMNPMNQAQASLVSIYQGADYSWNIHDYDSSRSWNRSLVELSPEHHEALKRYADNTSYHSFEDIKHDESLLLKPYLDAFDQALSSNQNFEQAVADLKGKFEEMIRDADELLGMDNELLVADLHEHLEAYKDLGQAGVAAMEGFEKAMNLDSDGMQASLAAMNDEIACANTHKIDAMNRNSGVYKEQAVVGSSKIRPFLAGLADKMNMAFKNALLTPVETRIISADGTASGTAGLAGANYQASLEATLGKESWAGMALDKAVKVSDITFTPNEGSDAEGLVLQYSLNGIDWSDFDPDGENVDAAYVRVVYTNDASKAISGTLEAVVVYSTEVTPEASTSMGRYQYNYISYITDGNMNTKFYSDAGSAVGDYVQVDYGKVIPIYDVSIWYAGNPKGVAEGVDGFKKTKLEVSTDNATWKQIGEIYTYGNEEQYVPVVEGSSVRFHLDWNGEGELARYVRFSADEAYDNWVQVFEVELNKNAPVGGDDEVLLAESNTNGAIRNLYDGDAATAFELASPAEGDYVTYQLSTITNVGELLILQDADTISNAKISVQNLDGSWKEVGVLDEAMKSIRLNQTCKAVRLDFIAGTPAKVQEIVVRPPAEEAVIDTALLERGLDALEALNLDAFAETGKGELGEAQTNAKAVLDNPESQQQVNEAAKRLNQALLGLRLHPEQAKADAL